MSSVFPYVFSLSRWSRTGSYYKVFGDDFDSLVLRDGVTIGRSDAVLDEDGLLFGFGIYVEKTVDRVAPETQEITWKFTLNDGKALPLGVVWHDCNFANASSDTDLRGSRQKKVAWISFVDGLVKEKVEIL